MDKPIIKPKQKSKPKYYLLVAAPVVVTLLILAGMAAIISSDLNTQSLNDQNLKAVINESNQPIIVLTEPGRALGSVAGVKTECGKDVYYFQDNKIEYNFQYNSCNWEILKDVKVNQENKVNQIKTLQIKSISSPVSMYLYVTSTPTTDQAVAKQYCTGYKQSYEARTLTAPDGHNYFGIYRLQPNGSKIYIWSNKKKVDTLFTTECLPASGVFDFKVYINNQVTKQSVFAFSNTIANPEEVKAQLQELDLMLLSLESR